MAFPDACFLPQPLGLLFAALSLALAESGPARLTVADARMLVASAPDLLRARQAGGCPHLKVLWHDGFSTAIEARDHCAPSNAGSIGTYFVDIRAAEVWADVDHRVRITSPRLASLRGKLLSRLRNSSPPRFK